MLRNYLSVVICFVVTVVCTAAQGQCDMSMGTCGRTPVLPEEKLAAADPVFGRYVDFGLLRRAWVELDAGGLTDAAMQMAEGERVLMRPHKEFSAADLMALAARAAVEKNDATTVERLGRIAKAGSDKPLLEQLAMATKLGGASRAAQTMPRLSVVETTPEQYGLLRQILGELQMARISGDLGRLDALSASLKAHPLVPESQRAQLVKSIGQAHAAVPKNAKINPAAEALQLACGTEIGNGSVMRIDLDRLGAGSRDCQVRGDCKNPVPDLGRLGAGSRCDPFDPTCGKKPVFPLDRLDAGSRCDASDPTCGKKPVFPLDRLDAGSRCDPGDPTCEKKPVFPLDRLDAGSRCDPSDPTCAKKPVLPLDRLDAGSRDCQINPLCDKPLMPKDTLAAADPAFGRYVDFGLLRRAWVELDADGLTDAALQMAEGERVLMRPYKDFSSNELLEVALRTAVEKRDEAALRRLSNAAKARGLAPFEAKVAGVMKLGSASRAAEAGMMVSVDEMTPEAYEVYHQLIRELQGRRIAGDGSDQLKRAIESSVELDDRQREQLLKLDAASRAAIPKGAKPNRAAAALRKLGAGSRCEPGDPDCI